MSASPVVPLVPFRLASWPSPLEPMPRLARHLGLADDALWIKRDDIGGVGGGGNKLRKLEYSLAAARAQGAQALVTVGAAQSNHARLTAAAGARVGLPVVLVLAGNPEPAPEGNLVLDALFGARLVWAGDADAATLEARALAEVQALGNEGITAALIPFGGSSVIAAQGYVEAGQELLTQAPDLAQVVVAVGSGGTMAGLVHALGAPRVLGVDTGAVPDPDAAVRALLDGLGGTAFTAPLQIRHDQVGAGYSHLTEPVRRALQLIARQEGIVLDPVYTGRAFAGLLAALDDGSLARDQRIVFLHSGGLPGLFGHPQRRTLGD